MKIEIKSYLTGSVLFEGDFSSVAKCLMAAVEKGLNLRGASLRDADLRDASLRDANLCDADLCGANLCGANLCGADLRGAGLRGADLRGADLCGANLCDADLCGAKNAELHIARTRILPEGDLIGWKKCQDNKIVKLLIPAAAKRSHAMGRKCRAEFAKVLEISEGKEAISDRDSGFIYRVGETVKPTLPFCENWQDECASGIHFYITRIEAENHE